ncbi:PQ loop repeat-domain-containing protein [Radiomyces spectabilis]|uniref:PQ loop repeat-domain-containing protein n=1 Tax=Radiomyces spectabilis TaxID=64574 RepID=UPI00221EF4B5|nr:PQ loop repeat-domain-containing protein [Radiomyces spectabilis]KAI8371656.1 PQ loop repeat-domain-containing protein [Radiomyces spectabilis]
MDDQLFNRELWSQIFGYLSIACWIVVFTPQLKENYIRKNTDGVSISFLLFWIFGDIFNLLGIILENLLLTMLLLALYYLFADVLLMGQVVYYRTHYRRQKVDEIVVASDASISEPTLAYTSHTVIPPSSRRSSHSSHSSSSSSSSSSSDDSHCVVALERTPLIQKTLSRESSYTLLATTSREMSPRTRRLVRYFTFISVLLWLGLAIGSVVFFFFPSDPKDKVDLSHWRLVPQLLGWASAILYCTSRIPQIMQNFRNESVEGLSLSMFLFSVMGNLTFCFSIFLQSMDRTYLLVNYPWLLGSGGTLFFDFTVNGSPRMILDSFFYLSITRLV